MENFIFCAVDIAAKREVTLFSFMNSDMVKPENMNHFPLVFRDIPRLHVDHVFQHLSTIFETWYRIINTYTKLSKKLTFITP